MSPPLMPEKAAKAFEAFAAAGYPQAKFTDALYRVLCHAFGFIAHYDRGGFYAKRFADLPGRIETLETMAEPGGWCKNRPMEVALRQVVVTRNLLDLARQALATQTEAAERAELARLKEKYKT